MLSSGDPKTRASMGPGSGICLSSSATAGTEDSMSYQELCTWLGEVMMKGSALVGYAARPFEPATAEVEWVSVGDDMNCIPVVVWRLVSQEHPFLTTNTTQLCRGLSYIGYMQIQR